MSELLLSIFTLLLNWHYLKLNATSFMQPVKDCVVPNPGMLGSSPAGRPPRYRTGFPMLTGLVLKLNNTPEMVGMELWSTPFKYKL